jgi:hypothetical protein
MFDESRPGPDVLAGADGAAVVAAIVGWARVEVTASARAALERVEAFPGRRRSRVLGSCRIVSALIALEVMVLQNGSPMEVRVSARAKEK